MNDRSLDTCTFGKGYNNFAAEASGVLKFALRHLHLHCSKASEVPSTGVMVMRRTFGRSIDIQANINYVAQLHHTYKVLKSLPNHSEQAEKCSINLLLIVSRRRLLLGFGLP